MFTENLYDLLKNYFDICSFKTTVAGPFGPIFSDLFVLGGGGGGVGWMGIKWGSNSSPLCPKKITETFDLLVLELANCILEIKT